MTNSNAIASPQRTSRLALGSLLLGLLALPLTLLTGVPALIVGYRALYAINASEGQLRGRRLALAGMLLGTVGCLLGVGYGLLLLVNRLGEASNRLECANNLRQIGQGLELYAKHHGDKYPKAVVDGTLPPTERLSWVAELAPLMPRKAMSEAKWQTILAALDPKQPWQAPVHQLPRDTNLIGLLCRSFPAGKVRDTPGLTDYVGVAGIGLDAAELPRQAPRAGFFGYNRQLRQKELADQQALTLIVVETTRDNGPWIAGGKPTVRDIEPEQDPQIGWERPFGGCHFNFDGQAGMNTLWLDGSVKYQTDAWPINLMIDQARINR